MARQPRFILPGQPQHVIHRGNNRSDIFFSEDDYLFYLDALCSAGQKHACEVHAYVLMTNHVHLLMTPQQGNSLSKVLQSVGRRFVQHINFTYERTGTLWEGRYRSTLIDSERYLLTCMRYIELNPVRAGLVRHPRHYRWSSYRANGEGKHDPLLSPHSLYENLGRTAVDCRRTYRELFKAPLEEATINAIRQSTNTGWTLGDDRFRRAIEAQLKRRAQPLPRGGDRRSVKYRKNPINPV
ncbi:MAG: transposase [Gammaproteobacteria bacterium]|jgi:putative transposase